MRKSHWLFALAVVALASFACSQDSGSGFTENPVAPTVADSSGLSNVTAGVRKNVVPVLLCHFNDTWETDLTLPYTVIEVDDSAAPKHCANHGDWNSAGSYGCATCDLTGLVVGDDCSACAPI